MKWIWAFEPGVLVGAALLLHAATASASVADCLIVGFVAVLVLGWRLERR